MGHRLAHQTEADGGDEQRNSIYNLAGDVQVDDASQGVKRLGKEGAGRPTRPLFVVAVETRDGRPIYTQLRCIPAFTKEAIKEYALHNIEPGSRVLSDGLACFNGFADAGMKHTPRITGGGRPEGDDFKWVNSGVSNVKSAITGTLRSCDPQHAPRYLAAFEWRDNRRFELAKNLERLAGAATTIVPQPRKSIAEIRSSAADLPGNQDHFCHYLSLPASPTPTRMNAVLAMSERALPFAEAYLAKAPDYDGRRTRV